MVIANAELNTRMIGNTRPVAFHFRKWLGGIEATSSVRAFRQVRRNLHEVIQTYLQDGTKLPLTPIDKCFVKNADVIITGPGIEKCDLQSERRSSQERSD